MAEYLLSSNSKLRLRQGIINQQRVSYFKGKHAVNALLRDDYKSRKNMPAVTDRDEGNKYLSDLLQNNMIMKVDKKPNEKILGLINPENQKFNPDQFYIWLYQVRTL